MSSEAIPGLYERHAADWDAGRSRQGLIEGEWLEKFLQLVPQAGEVLDLGCGSGRPIAEHLIGAGCRVTGVDVAPAMIDMCRARFPDHEWAVSDMRRLDPGRRFDGLIAWHSAFHLTRDEQRAMFAVYGRHLRPGAPLMFTSGPYDGEAIGEWHGQPLYHGSLAPEEYRERLDEAGFDVLDYRPEDESCGRATVWLARRRHDSMGA